MHDFYSRVEAAHEYARSLENNLGHVSHALLQCKGSLASSWEELNQGRLEYQKVQKELVLERERHKDTMDMLQKVLHEAMRSSEIADSLSGEIVKLRAAGVAAATLETPASMIKAPYTTAASPDTPTSINQQSGPAQAPKDVCDAGEGATPSTHEILQHAKSNLSDASASRCYDSGSETIFKTAKNPSSISRLPRESLPARERRGPRKSRPNSGTSSTKFPEALEKGPSNVR